VVVRDPCHPLFGRRFRVAARPAGIAGSETRSMGQNMLVFYRAGLQLRLPVAAVELPKTGQAPPTKLTASTIAELVSMVLALRASGEGEGRARCSEGDDHGDRSKPTLGRARRRTQGADCRRSRRRTSGGAR
jgi:hypothetical protein